MQDPDEEEEYSRMKQNGVQNYIPGFIGYVSKEGVRDDDRLMRLQMNQKIAIARNNLTFARSDMAKGGLSVELDNLDSIVHALQRLDGEITYAEMGCAGFDRSFSISDEDIARLCEFDITLLGHLGTILSLAGNIRADANSGELASLKKHMNDFRAEIGFVEEVFQRRMGMVSQR